MTTRWMANRVAGLRSLVTKHVQAVEKARKTAIVGEDEARRA